MCDIGLPLVRQNMRKFSEQLAKSLSKNEAIILVVSLMSCFGNVLIFVLCGSISFVS